MLDRRVGLIGEVAWSQYAVFIPFIKQDGDLSILFQKRAKNVAQAGEISFPGGKLEAGETSLTAAIRETREELLVGDSQLEILLPGDVFLTPGGRKIEPFIGSIEDYQGSFSKDEVEEVFAIPYKELLHMEAKRTTNKVFLDLDKNFPFSDIPYGKDYPWQMGSYDILFYYWKNYVIWGITARILESALELIKEHQLIQRINI